MPTNHFTGVLAVLHAPTADGRRLDEPHPDLARPTPLALRTPDGGPVGAITRVWRDGDLIRYSGHLDPDYEPSVVATKLIGQKRLVGMLDADSAELRHFYRGNPVSDEEAEALPPDTDPRDFTVVMHGWRVAAVTLLSPDGKAWPEVSLTLDEEPPPQA